MALSGPAAKIYCWNFRIFAKFTFRDLEQLSSLSSREFSSFTSENAEEETPLGWNLVRVPKGKHMQFLTHGVLLRNSNGEIRKFTFSRSPPPHWASYDGKTKVLNSWAFPKIHRRETTKNQISNCRAFSNTSNVGSETEADDYDEVNSDCTENIRSDPKEVERVYKIIEDLFASDRNMEAVLDQCNINLSHSLVVDILARFRHARKPAFRFFCWAAQKPEFSHNSDTYNLMMGILGKTRQFESMVEMLEEMGKKGFLTIETFIISIRAFASAREMKKAVGIFELMRRYNFEAGIDTFNCLLDALGRAKLAKEAQALFEKLKDRFQPDLRTYSVLLSGWCKVRNLMEAGQVWNEMIDKGLKPDIVTHNTLLEGLFSGQRRPEAIKLFELMKAKGPGPNVRSYTIVIRDLCKKGKMEAAVNYFNEMLDRGCEPDPAVYTCLIVGYGNEKKMDKVYGLLKEMKEKGCPPDGRTYNALIKLMTNRNMPDDAVRIYKKMIQNGFEPTIHTYNMLMKSYFRMKNCEMGSAVWEEMGKKGCCPDDNSYTVFIAGLISNGRSEEACKYIEEMLNKGMKAPQLDYNKFAADFSRAGKPDVLSELSQKMKFAGKFEDANLFSRWADMMKKRVKRRDCNPTGMQLC
ncbi:pentatricopeptide repeat-containing protein At3g62470, mitochondrial-like [Aristolochia californica]|uniref:pentatricopeptide repeat-containing protein At3g62470, mitochondrial-like n=1 Tax=Aristolochia californica TaxID=171875 RepID=UPI0035D8A9E6